MLSPGLGLVTRHRSLQWLPGALGRIRGEQPPLSSALPCPCVRGWASGCRCLSSSVTDSGVTSGWDGALAEEQVGGELGDLSPGLKVDPGVSVPHVIKTLSCPCLGLEGSMQQSWWQQSLRELPGLGTDGEDSQSDCEERQAAPWLRHTPCRGLGRSRGAQAAPGHP